MKINAVILFMLIILLSACSSTSAPPVIDPTNYAQLQTACYVPPRNGSAGCAGISSIRTKALEDTALSLAAQGGLAWASKKINCQLGVGDEQALSANKLMSKIFFIFIGSLGNRRLIVNHF